MKTYYWNARVCPSNENYRKSDGRMNYDLLNKWKKVEFTPYRIIKVITETYAKEEIEIDVYFGSDRAYKRCKKLYDEWYYKLTPYQKGL